MRINQHLTPSTAMQISGVRLRLHNAGGPITVALIDPNSASSAMGICTLQPADIAPDGWTTAHWPPVFVAKGQPLAVEVLGTDHNTQVGVARIGDKDHAAGKWAALTSAEIGMLVSYDANDTPTEHAATMLSMQVLVPEYVASTADVPLGTVVLENVTDVCILAGIQQPETTTGCTFFVALDGGTVHELSNAQRLNLGTLYTGNATITARLQRGATMAPVLEPGTTLAFGKLEPQADYIGAVFQMAGSNRLRVIYQADTPSGASVSVQMQASTAAAGAAWTNVPWVQSSGGTVGFVEHTHELTGVTAQAVRLRLVLSGTPTARPMLDNLRAVAL